MAFDRLRQYVASLKMTEDGRFNNPNKKIATELRLANSGSVFFERMFDAAGVADIVTPVCVVDHPCHVVHPRKDVEAARKFAVEELGVLFRVRDYNMVG